MQAIVEEGQAQGVIDPSLNSRILTHGLHGAVLQILVGWIQGFIPVSPSSTAGAYDFIRSTSSSLPGNGKGKIRPSPGVKFKKEFVETRNHF